MAAKSVSCIARTTAQADEIVSQLQLASFPPENVSVLMPDRQGTRDFAHEHHTKAPEGAAAGGAVAGVVGGALGWLVGIGALAIPGLGPFIAAGPILAAMSGAAAGAVTGGVAGGLIGLGIPELEAKRYEGKIKNGNILLAVHVRDSREKGLAKDIFERAHAEDISSTSEASVPNN